MFKSFCVMNKSFPYDLYTMYTHTAVDSPARRLQEKKEEKKPFYAFITRNMTRTKKTKNEKKEKIEIMSVMNECKKKEETKSSLCGALSILSIFRDESNSNGIDLLVNRLAFFKKDEKKTLQKEEQGDQHKFK